MRIQLIFAPPLNKPRYDEWYEGHLPPLGILYLASYLRKSFDGLELKATDGLIRGMQRTYDEIIDFRPDVLGVSVFTAVALGSYELINRVKQTLPKTLIVVGGPHPTALPQDVLIRSQADVVVLGEGEITLSELIGLYLDKGCWLEDELVGIKGIGYRQQDHLVINPVRPYIENLDSIPFPARDLLPIQDYHGYYFRKRAPEYPMVFTRGCPFECTFCAGEVWKLTKPVGSFRWRSPSNVIDEMEDLHYNYGINEIQDVSDELNGNPNNALEICEEKIKRHLDIPWKSMIRVHPLSQQLTAAMAESGCWQVSIGIESGNQETLDGVGKGFKLNQLDDSLYLLKKNHIKTQGLFMLFNVWENQGQLHYETVEMSRNTINYANSLVKRGLLQYTGNFGIATPYPGSKLYQIAIRNNLIKQEIIGQWDRWLVEEPIVMNLPGIKNKDQIRLLTAGSLSISKCLWTEGHIGVRDLPDLVKRSLKVVRSEAMAIRKS
jgi:radical SAM superfamily enzyme YgiQ (UPF0313 family)